jgi:O-antigen/teichoic acid export membrane protein
MLNIFIGFQGLSDLGFSNTFVRAISYAKGGITKILKFQDNTTPVERQEGTNWVLIDRIYGTTSKLFLFLALLFGLFFSIAGFLSLRKPISLTDHTLFGWLSLAVVVIATVINIYGSKYTIFLQGVNKIPQLRRWETFFSLASIITLFIVLQLTDSYFYLILTQQVFTVLSVLRNRMLTNKYHGNIVKTFKQKKIDKELLLTLFPAAWRSWIGVLMSYGLVQVSGIIVGQSSNTAMTSSYLFTLRILDMIKGFSNAPFYSKIPLMNRLFAENNRSELMRVAERGIFLSLGVFAVVSVGVALLGNVLLGWIDSNITLSDGPILMTLILAFYIERYGALHIQLYSLTNNIIWHIANGVTGVIYILTTLALWSYTNVGFLSFPLGMLAGNVLFYGWYTVVHSYRFFKLEFPAFELRTAALPHVLIVIYLLVQIILI